MNGGPISRKFKREGVIFHLVLWIACALLILIKGDLLNRLTPIPIDLECVIITTAYLLAYGREAGAGIFALCQGLFTDILSGGIWGFHAILYLTIFLFIKLLSRPFDMFSVSGQISLAFIAVLVKELLSVPLLYMFFQDIDISFDMFITFILSAALSGLIAPLIFYFLNALGRLFFGSKEEFLGTV
ncbi:MAG: rod shape-determining protein MreD [Deltaproteobacteria bacterium]|nr:rod shape-determining protein MreD [Deltaproteobacteria bacterium]